jgi:hypothetical protein
MFDGVMMGKAADEIEALRKEVAALRSGAAPSTAAQGATLTDDDSIITELQRCVDNRVYGNPVIVKALESLKRQRKHALNLCRINHELESKLRVSYGNAPTPVADSGAMPVARVDESDEGLFVEILYGDNGTPLKRGDDLYLAAAKPVSVDAGWVPDRMAFLALLKKWESWQADGERRGCPTTNGMGAAIADLRALITPPTESTGEPT